MSTIKLPPPSFYHKHEDICGNEVGPPTPFWNQTAVEEAVRQALAAQVPPILSTVLEQMWEWATGEGPAPRWQDIDDARRAFQQAQNSPENDHG